MSEEAVYGDTEITSDASFFPADECPLQRPIQSLYFVKYPLYEDSETLLKIAEAEDQVLKRNQTRNKLNEELTLKIAERVIVISQLCEKKLKKLIKAERTNLEYHQRFHQKECRARPVTSGRCADQSMSKQKRNKQISRLCHRMPHGGKTLVEEKKLLRELIDTERTEDDFVGNEKMKEEICYKPMNSSVKWCCSIHVFRRGIRCMVVDDFVIKIEKKAISTKINHLEGSLKKIEEQISLLRKELETLNPLRSKAYGDLLELQKQHEKANGYYCENQALLKMAREFAEKKDLWALEKLSCTEAEKFMVEWNSSNTFRNDYKKKLLTSLDNRQMNIDGRIRNSDEQPSVSDQTIDAYSTASVRKDMRFSPE